MFSANPLVEGEIVAFQCQSERERDTATVLCLCHYLEDSGNRLTIIVVGHGHVYSCAHELLSLGTLFHEKIDCTWVLSERDDIHFTNMIDVSLGQSRPFNLIYHPSPSVECCCFGLVNFI